MKRLTLAGVLLLLAACGGSGTGGDGGAGSGGDVSVDAVQAMAGVTVTADTLTIDLPGVTIAHSPYDLYPLLHPDETHADDTITVPNGRPIYALLVSGYSSNPDLSEFYYYNFAKYVAEQGGYVHFAWWNNLLAPYMERPLHEDDSSPGWEFVPPVSDAAELLGAPSFLPVSPTYGEKAYPREDLQFQADAKRFLRAVRENNPDAIIVVVGHSMGGGAVSRLGFDLPDDLDIDVLAPVDPVGNRSWPATALAHEHRSDYNWTRWRATREEFRGYRQMDCVRGDGVDKRCKNFAKRKLLDPPIYHCRAIGPWRNDPLIPGHLWLASLVPLKCPGPYIHNPAPRKLGTNIKYLYHRYQKEFIFPFDFGNDQYFGFWAPLVASGNVEDGNNIQKPVVTCADGNDPQIPAIECHNHDGHGEIIGARQYNVDTGEKKLVFYATKATGDWPAFEPGESSANRSLRKNLVQDFVETGDPGGHTPRYPQLDMVSEDLIRIVQILGRPVAVPGGPYVGKGCEPIRFDGSASYDADGEIVSYAWDFDNDGTIDESGPSPTVEHVYGTTYIGTVRLVVTDNDGNTGEATSPVAVVEVPSTAPPEITSLQADPDTLWAPNHVMVPGTVSVSLADQCPVDCRIVSVQSNEPENGLGDGDTAPDWEITGNLTLNLRAERAGTGSGRVYTVTVECTNLFGNTDTSTTEVVVPHDMGVP